MKTLSVNAILKEVLSEIKPSKEEIQEINRFLKNFLESIEKRRKKLKINAQIFVGGSAAKKTLMKKDKYDIDIFVRFDKKYPDDKISDFTEKILHGFKFERIHGSRDYFRIKSKENTNVFFEIVPVRKINSAREAVNITDLSYYHVKYINKKIKNEKILDEIMLAKAFCNANHCYGAESYINGFSGYGLELLVYKYKSFLKFIREMAKVKPGQKLVIDIEKHHKQKSHVLIDLNSAKLESPIVLIDPTHKQRNVLAALSENTFVKFQRACNEFLKRPSIGNFEKTRVDANAWKQEAKRKKLEFLIVEARTSKQSGDIAGSKLLKFYKTLEREIGRFFDIKKSWFEYHDGKTARYFFIVKSKGKMLVSGPHEKHVKHAKRFRAKHKPVFVKKGRLHAHINAQKSLKDFLADWKKKNQRVMKDMSVVSLKVI